MSLKAQMKSKSDLASLLKFLLELSEDYYLEMPAKNYPRWPVSLLLEFKKFLSNEKETQTENIKTRCCLRGGLELIKPIDLFSAKTAIKLSELLKSGYLFPSRLNLTCEPSHSFLKSLSSVGWRELAIPRIFLKTPALYCADYFLRLYDPNVLFIS